MIVVTGGAGFIGSCLLARLNELGMGEIIVVDHLDDQGLKKENLARKRYRAFYDKQDFLEKIRRDELLQEVSCVFHMGACSSTTGTDRDYYIRNNFEYSCEVARWALNKGARFIYASSAATYGDGDQGYCDDPSLISQLRPLNYYGESKQLFDEWIMAQGLYGQVAGLKFFNVYGPNEMHKGDMRSVIAKAYEKVVAEGVMILFKSDRPDYADGEQKRDFIYVKDVVSVMIYLMRNTAINGIFNLGTGQARTWNDLALALFAAAGKPPRIEYVAMPSHLRNRYQYFTQAQMGRLRQAGYTDEFMPLEQAVRDYVLYLSSGSRW